VGLLDGLGQLAANAIAPAANARAAYLSGQRQAQDDQRKQGIQLLMLKRQQDQDARDQALADRHMRLMESQADAADALAKYRGTAPGEYRQDASGQYVWFPRRQPTGDDHQSTPLDSININRKQIGADSTETYLVDQLDLVAHVSTR
jgi:hypothetical protein